MSFKFDMESIEKSTHIFTEKEKQQLLAQYKSDEASAESADFIPIINFNPDMNFSPDFTTFTVATNGENTGSGIYTTTSTSSFEDSSMFDHNLESLNKFGLFDDYSTNLTTDLDGSTDKNGGQNFITSGVIDSAA